MYPKTCNEFPLPPDPFRIGPTDAYCSINGSATFRCMPYVSGGSYYEINGELNRSRSNYVTQTQEGAHSLTVPNCAANYNSTIIKCIALLPGMGWIVSAEARLFIQGE